MIKCPKRAVNNTFFWVLNVNDFTFSNSQFYFSAKIIIMRFSERNRSWTHHHQQHPPPTPSVSQTLSSISSCLRRVIWKIHKLLIQTRHIHGILWRFQVLQWPFCHIHLPKCCTMWTMTTMTTIPLWSLLSDSVPLSLRSLPLHLRRETELSVAFQTESRSALVTKTTTTKILTKITNSNLENVSWPTKTIGHLHRHQGTILTPLTSLLPCPRWSLIILLWLLRHADLPQPLNTTLSENFFPMTSFAMRHTSRHLWLLLLYHRRVKCRRHVKCFTPNKL